MITIYTIRHGETDGNKAGELQGWTDKPLNEKGWDLAVITAKALSDVHFDVVYSSPLKRALETAQIMIQRNSHKASIITDDRLKELHFGEWEQRCVLPGKTNIPLDNIKAFYNDPYNFQNASDGESINHLCERTRDFFLEIINNPANEDKTILISTHGIAVRGFLNNIYKNKLDFWHGGLPDNCSVNVIEVTDGVAELIVDDKIFYDKDLSWNPYR